MVQFVVEEGITDEEAVRYIQQVSGNCFVDSLRVQLFKLDLVSYILDH